VYSRAAGGLYKEVVMIIKVVLIIFLLYNLPPLLFSLFSIVAAALKVIPRRQAPHD